MITTEEQRAVLLKHIPCSEQGNLRMYQTGGLSKSEDNQYITKSFLCATLMI